MNIYESTKLLDEYLLFHYGRPEEVLPWDFGPRAALDFPMRTVHELIDAKRLTADARALDVGCAVGRSSFELARFCSEVTGIDFSKAFVEAASELQRHGTLAFNRMEEAATSTMLVARVPDDLLRDRVRFEVGDAMNLRCDLGAFEVVHAANLLCRLSDPERFIERLPALVRPGGQLLLTTPCTWLEEFTPRRNWPRGSTREWLHQQLGEHFQIEVERDMPFFIREHARKFQWSVAIGMRWARKG